MSVMPRITPARPRGLAVWGRLMARSAVKAAQRPGWHQNLGLPGGRA